VIKFDYGLLRELKAIRICWAREVILCCNFKCI